MAKIIPLTSENGTSINVITISDYVAAIWKLACVCIWPYEQIHSAEATRCKNYIKADLTRFNDLQEGFLQTCQYIILYNRFLVSSICWPVEKPAIWFHPQFSEGFTATKDHYHFLLSKRATEPQYQEGIKVLAEAYSQYLRVPITVTHLNYRNKLLLLREYGLVQIMDNVIMRHILYPKN